VGTSPAQFSAAIARYAASASSITGKADGTQTERASYLITREIVDR